MAKVEGATAEAKREGPVSKETADEIDQAVEEVLKEDDREAESPEPPAEKDTPKEGEKESADQRDEESDKDHEGEETPDESEPEEDTSEAEARSDELVTRAIRAGMSLKDAKTIVAQDVDALERQIQLLEKAGQTAKAQAGEGDEEADAGKSAGADEDPLAGIPDLDPDLYDENIVAGFQAMKSIIKKQGETISRLSSGGEKDWFDSQVKALNIKDLTADQRAELNNQFDVLKAGYAAKGQKVDDGSIFQLASKMILGDAMKEAKEVKTEKKLEKRAAMQTNRPGGTAARKKGDAFEEVAEEVDKEVFGKK